MFRTYNIQIPIIVRIYSKNRAGAQALQSINILNLKSKIKFIYNQHYSVLPFTY